jgi:hypothetical protein
MPTNLLIALKNIIQNPVVDLTSKSVSSNRINSIGEGLEVYIKDAFCGTFNFDDEEHKQEIFADNFSYSGNQNNPPDIIIRNGDAIEVKKLESPNSAIALNSSYPKDKLYTDSPMITEACRNCEDWKEKDLLYSIGVASNKILRSLWFVYGDCYAANKEVYEKALEEIQNIKESPLQVDFRCEKIDLLDITKYSSKEGWAMQNPNQVFNYLENIDKFDINCLMSLDKYSSFPIENIAEIESNKKIKIQNVKIKNPNNTAKLLSAKLIQANFIS